jgi:hypothetical protein
VHAALDRSEPNAGVGDACSCPGAGSRLMRPSLAAAYCERFQVSRCDFEDDLLLRSLPRTTRGFATWLLRHCPGFFDRDRREISSLGSFGTVEGVMGGVTRLCARPWQETGLARALFRPSGRRLVSIATEVLARAD